jgi:hypothetical protein
LRIAEAACFLFDRFRALSRSEDDGFAFEESALEQDIAPAAANNKTHAHSRLVFSIFIVLLIDRLPILRSRKFHATPIFYSRHNSRGSRASLACAASIPVRQS